MNAPHPTPPRTDDAEHDAVPRPAPAVPGVGQLGRVALGGALVLGVAIACGVALRVRGARATDAPPTTSRVEVVRPKPAAPESELSLPATVEALRETAVFARASGYVRKWLVDIGDKVEGGQLLAELDTPDLEQQLLQARANVGAKRAAADQVRASLELSRLQAKRYEAMAATGLASQEQLDESRSKLAVDEASVKAADATTESEVANVRRLEQLKSWAHVTAPFAGTITARNVEVGSLVGEGTAGGQGLFRITASDPVRVFVPVPQDVASMVKPGMKAQIRFTESPGRTYEGTVTRTAGALDPATRTLRTEIRVPNGDGSLLAGMYARVALSVPAAHRALLLPSTAVLADANGTQVAVVGDDGTIHRVRVVQERDTGSEAVIGAGLSGDERVIANPGPQAVDGRVVVAVERGAK